MTSASAAPPAAGPAPRPGRLAGRVARLPPWLTVLLAVLAWAAALAAVAPIVYGYLTSPPDQRLVDLDVYRTGGLAVLRGQPLYSVLTQPPQLLPFTYPPLAAVFAVPLAVLSWPAAQLVWVAFVYVPLAVIIGYAFRPLLRRAGPSRRSRSPRSSVPARTCSRCGRRCGSARLTRCWRPWSWPIAPRRGRAGHGVP